MGDQPTPQDAARLLFQLKNNLHRVHQTKTASGLSAQMAMLRTWQSKRLARTHADLLASKRYGPACRFFLADIYAPRDFSQRDHDIERMYHFMLKFLPKRLLHPLTLAIELNTLTHHLDNTLLDALINHLGITTAITAEQYAEAYRICNNYNERAQQINMVVEIGHNLGRLSRLPLISFSLRLARKPAHQAGWLELQDFLERGLDAFKQMRGTKTFLTTIEQRERQILDQIFTRHPQPFTL